MTSPNSSSFVLTSFQATYKWYLYIPLHNLDKTLMNLLPLSPNYKSGVWNNHVTCSESYSQQVTKDSNPYIPVLHFLTPLLVYWLLEACLSESHSKTVCDTIIGPLTSLVISFINAKRYSFISEERSRTLHFENWWQFQDWKILL